MELRVKEICKVKGVQMQELADRLNISRVTLTRNINGNPTIDTLEKIAEGLNVDVIELFAKKSGFTAFIDYRGTLYRCDSIDELEGLIKRLKTTAEN
ncbi:MAG: XRE family transcriptional regulator [Flavobacteriales bacterium]|nr:MAG: XRE family transcriptional regulator [Flavobacteriales bacterium]